MARILVCSEDSLSTLRIERILSREGYSHETVRTAIRTESLANFDFLIIHSSYRLSGLTRFIDHLVISRTIPVVFLSSTSGIGGLQQLIDQPYFFYLDENKMDCELGPTLKAVAKFVPVLKEDADRIRKAEARVDSEKMLQQCKKRLIASGMSEESAHQFILKTAMDHQLSKYDACVRILADFHE